MIVLRRLWDADGCVPVIMFMDRGSDGCGPVAAISSFSFSFFFWFCVVLLGSDWAPIMRGRHKTTCYQIFDLIFGLDLVLGFWVLI